MDKFTSEHRDWLKSFMAEVRSGTAYSPETAKRLLSLPGSPVLFGVDIATGKESASIDPVFLTSCGQQAGRFKIAISNLYNVV